MRPNILAEKIRSGKTVIGLNNMYPASGIIEGMCQGWDFVWVDGQHGQQSYDSILHALQAAGHIGVDAIVRVPSHEYGFLGPYADLAPSCIMVPMVDNLEQARNVVGGLRFPPLGARSYGGRRVIDLDGREYFHERELLVLAQIETQEGVKNAEAIAATNGIDGLFFGPDDMKMRMGIPINASIENNAEIRKAMETTARAALNAGKFVGAVAGNAAGLTAAMEMGYRLLACGSDIQFMRTAASARLAEFKAVIEKKAVAAKPKAGESASPY